MDVKRLYEEQMKKFFDLSTSVRDAVYVVFPSGKNAEIDDLHDARLLVEKMQEAKYYLDTLLRVKNMKVNGEKTRPI